MYKTLMEDSLSQQALLPLSHRWPWLLADVHVHRQLCQLLRLAWLTEAETKSVQFVSYSVRETPGSRVMPALGIYLSCILQGPGFSLLWVRDLQVSFQTA